MSLISSTFERLRNKNRKALIPFITAGDPQPTITVSLMHVLVASGADIIELGVPFSDPMADGPTIQRSSERALKHGVTLRKVLRFVAEFRKKNFSTPVVLMGYANPVEALGYAQFAGEAKAAGVDGVLIVDLPPEEGSDLVAELMRCGIDAIFLIAPTTTDARIRKITQLASGYIYYVSLNGVTGATHLDLSDVGKRIQLIKSCVDLPVGVGFGIRDAATARAVSEMADGVIVGSCLVQEIENSAPEALADNAARLMQDFRDAMDKR